MTSAVKYPGDTRTGRAVASLCTDPDFVDAGTMELSGGYRDSAPPWRSNALQTGVVDGAVMPPDLMVSSRLYEVAKQLSLTRHFSTPPRDDL